jgi:hypothetical protein
MKFASRQRPRAASRLAKVGLSLASNNARKKTGQSPVSFATQFKT